MSDLNLTDTQVIRILAAAYEPGTKRIVETIQRHVLAPPVLPHELARAESEAA